MNLDDLMAVWKSQDTSPLEDKTLLHLALRQEQTKLQKQRRMDKWIVYIMSAIFIAVMGLCLSLMIYPEEYDVLVWDYVVLAVGVASALVMAGAMFAMRRVQTTRDQGFGESLRDQLRHRIAQLDDQATKERHLLRIIVAAILVCGLAIYIALRRVNDVAYSENWPVVTGLIILFAHFAGYRAARRRVQRDILPRKQRLETLLKELDGE